MSSIQVTTKLTAEDYARLRFFLLFRSAGFYVLVVFVIAAFWVADFSAKNEAGNPDIFGFIPFIVAMAIIIYLPFKVYFGSKRMFKFNLRIQENITYEFDTMLIQVTGESFNSKLTWEKVYRVSESPQMILIWQSRTHMNLVPKKCFAGDDLNRFKQMVKEIRGPQNKLKY